VNTHPGAYPRVEEQKGRLWPYLYALDYTREACQGQTLDLITKDLANKIMNINIFIYFYLSAIFKKHILSINTKVFVVN
jgi:hypothetical protein